MISIKYSGRIFFSSCLYLILMIGFGCRTGYANEALISRIETIQQKNFPRLMGMNIAIDDYQLPSYQRALAKLDVVILGFYPGWKKIVSAQPIREAVRSIKQLNPNILVGQYTMLSEVQTNLKQFSMFSYKINKIDREDWWLRDVNGNKVQWTNMYDTWMINYTNWTKPDEEGLYYPEWLASQDFNLYFQPVPEFDIWYFDNVYSNPRIKEANWKLNNINYSNTDAEIQKAVRDGNAKEWASARMLAPNVLMFGNSDNDLYFPEYSNKLNAAFLEGLMGKSWSFETVGGWDVMMDHYNRIFTNLLEPKLVGFNVWGKINNYNYFRYAFASCLMNNGFFSYTDVDVGYASVPWFDEYNISLGKAIDMPGQVKIYQGVRIRQFEQGLVLVNPTTKSVNVPIGSGYKRIIGVQDPSVNNGLPVKDTITLDPKSGLLLIKS